MGRRSGTPLDFGIAWSRRAGLALPSHVTRQGEPCPTGGSSLLGRFPLDPKIERATRVSKRYRIRD